MGIGSGVGENRAQTAARTAIASPLLETSIEGAKGMLFNIIGPTDITMSEVHQAAEVISRAADADAEIIFGAVIDDSLVDQIKITVIATGFDETRQKLREISSRAAPGRVQQQPQNEEPEQQNEPQPKEFSEKPDESDEFDIPAFLRQGR